MLAGARVEQSDEDGANFGGTTLMADNDDEVTPSGSAGSVDSGGSTDSAVAGNTADALAVAPDEVLAAAAAEEEGEKDQTESVSEPAKVLRIGSMVKTLLDEVRSAPLDEKSRVRLREIYEQSVQELSEGSGGRAATDDASFRRRAQRRRAPHCAGPARGLARRVVPRDPGHLDVATDGGSGSARGDAPARPPGGGRNRSDRGVLVSFSVSAQL
jgi:hypothetical protein